MAASHSHCVHVVREESQRIADIFLSRRAEFLAFTTYIGHYDRSMSLLEDSCRTSPAFAAIVHQFEVSWNDCGKKFQSLTALSLKHYVCAKYQELQLSLHTIC